MPQFNQTFSYPAVTVPVETIIKILDWEMFALVHNGIVCTALGLFGLVANVINILVFFKQGLNNSMNISFFSMSVADIIHILAVEWANVCFNPYIDNLQAPIIFTDLYYFTGGWVNGCACRITLYHMVCITAERCLSIVYPLKIKTMITTRRMVVIIVAVDLMHVLTLVPEYVTVTLTWRFFPSRNRTLLSLGIRDGSAKGVTFLLHFILAFLGQVLVIIFTAILTLHLKRQTSWRQTVTKEIVKKNKKSFSSRDKKSMILVVVIASVLIVCYSPSILCLVTFILPEFYVGGKLFPLFRDAWAFAYLFAILNSGINIFIFYNVSSNYKNTFKQFFRCLITVTSVAVNNAQFSFKYS
ncbi:P2Y purinoceptor 8 [Biomphalaria glabrata]|nr:P2Y purinoceptor 8-like [Biomphalaria glabrata]